MTISFPDLFLIFLFFLFIYFVEQLLGMSSSGSPFLGELVRGLHDLSIVIACEWGVQGNLYKCTIGKVNSIGCEPVTGWGDSVTF